MTCHLHYILGGIMYNILTCDLAQFTHSHHSFPTQIPQFIHCLVSRDPYVEIWLYMGWGNPSFHL